MKNNKNNFSQLSKRSMLNPINCKDQDSLIVEGIHGKRIHPVTNEKRPFSERSRVAYLKAQCKGSFTGTKIYSNTLNYKNPIIKVRCCVANTTKSNVFKTTYIQHLAEACKTDLMKRLRAEGYQVTHMYENGTLTYRSK